MAETQETIDSTEAFYYLWLSWNLQGIYKIKSYKIQHKIFLVATVIVTNILYIATFITELFVEKDKKRLVANIKSNITLLICALKFFAILRMRLKLLEADELVRRLDTRSFTKEQRNAFRAVVKTCHRVTIAAFVAFSLGNVIYGTTAVLSDCNMLLHETWVPFDWRGNCNLFWIIFIVQYALTMQMVCENQTNDTCAPIYLNVINMHLRFLMERIAKIHHDRRKSEKESLKEFLDCVRDHKVIMKMFEIVEQIVSLTVFLQFFATIFIIVACAASCLMLDLNIGEIMSLIGLMFCEVMEIFPVCYYGNKFMVTTDQFIGAIYSMNWMDLSPKFRKLLIIFMSMVQKKKILYGGKQISVTLPTFLSVMKLSYSMFTVVQQM